MKPNVKIIAPVGLGILLLAVFLVSTVHRGPVEVNSGYRVVMGTFSRMLVVAPSERAGLACVEAAFEKQRRVDSLMSSYKADSQLSQVNRSAAERPVEVDAFTFDVLQRAVRASELSDGAFDVTVGPLVDLWRAAGEANEPPAEAALVEARRKVGYDKLLLNEADRTVRFAVDGMRLDLGGIAKGYAIDLSVEAISKHGALGGLVDIGGDVRCFGRPPKGQAEWRIGLQDPAVGPDDLSSGIPLLVLKVSDAAVTTSGHYRRYVEVDGHKQSHIVDSMTGKGADKLVSVTVIAPDATTADALATAVSVLGPEKGLALIEQLDNVEAILIPSGSGAKPVFSAGAAAYVE
jgi:thiamine biosynthesis lipoprotein